ncbi:hypothetical protein [Nannocystis pusilla]|uniref:hypothetical protein n=1 Tax=Nannocystis pusilla TaxID=889268 RepID=UPI003DA2492E
MHHPPRVIALVTFLLTFAPALRSRAEPAITTKDFEDIVVVNSCNGDIVPVHLTTHAIFHPKSDGSVDIQVIIEGAGTSLSGTDYVVHQHNKLEIGGDDPQFEIDALLVSKGDEPDEHVTIRFNFETMMQEVETRCLG